MIAASRSFCRHGKPTNFAYVIWEEGPGANDNATDNFDLVFSTLDFSGQIGY